MTSAVNQQVANIVACALAGNALTRDDVTLLYGLDVYSPEAYHVLWGANKLARQLSNNEALIYAQVGMDAQPCPGGCHFCSFAVCNQSAWEAERILTKDTVLRYAESFDRHGAHMISLMTTASYDFEKYLNVLEAVRSVVDPKTALMVNIGDFDAEQASALKAAGGNVVYHAVRIGEGQITAIDPKCRYATLSAAKAAGFTLSSGVEPVYQEQDAEAVIDRLIEVAAWDLVCAGFGNLHAVKDTKMASKTPLTHPHYNYLAWLYRLVAGRHCPFGHGNTLWTDSGTNPRNNHMFPGDECIEDDIARLRKRLTDDEWSIPNALPQSWYGVA